MAVQGTPQAAAAAANTAPAAAAPVNNFGENKGIKFQIKTGTNTWACTLQDRSSYDRLKASRSASSDTLNSASSGSTH